MFRVLFIVNASISWILVASHSGVTLHSIWIFTFVIYTILIFVYYTYDWVHFHLNMKWVLVCGVNCGEINFVNFFSKYSFFLLEIQFLNTYHWLRFIAKTWIIYTRRCILNLQINEPLFYALWLYALYSIYFLLLLSILAQSFFRRNYHE